LCPASVQQWIYALLPVGRGGLTTFSPPLFATAKTSYTRETLAERYEQDIITNLAVCGENTFLRMELQ